MTVKTLEGLSLPVGVLSLNPAVDMTYEFSRLIEDQKVHAVATRFDPGGNGVNVTRALQRLATPARNYCVIAGEIGQLLKRLAVGQMDDVHYEEVRGETRINGTFIGHVPRVQYEVSGIGPDIPASQLDELLAHFVEYSAKGIGVLTGSLQQALPLTLYAELTQRIKLLDGRVVVDAHNEALCSVLDRGPFLIKPNRYELETVLGRSLDGLHTVAEAARRLQHQGIQYVCVSLDRDGALLVGPDNSYYAAAPKVAVFSSVGAGDSMVAALVAVFSRDGTPQEALRLGVACATGTVGKSGTELFSVADVGNYYERVSVRCLDI